MTEAFWDRELITLPQWSNLSVTCSVVGVGRQDVVRVVHSYQAKTLLLADNDVLGHSFAVLPRYSVNHQYEGDTTRVTVSIDGQSRSLGLYSSLFTELVAKINKYNRLMKINKKT